MKMYEFVYFGSIQLTFSMNVLASNKKINCPQHEKIVLCGKRRLRSADRTAEPCRICPRTATDLDLNCSHNYLQFKDSFPPNAHQIFQPELEKTYLLTHAPNEDSNQPAHPHSLIRNQPVHPHIRILCPQE